MDDTQGVPKGLLRNFVKFIRFSSLKSCSGGRDRLKATKAESALIFLCAILLCSCMGEARADAGRVTIIEDNDGLLPDGWDRHYTQGFFVSYLSSTLDDTDVSQTFYNDLSKNTPLMQPSSDASRKFEVMAGQSIFTPVKYHDTTPDPKDRPFAGFLYGGGSLLQDIGGHMLEDFEVLAGVVGPAALARQTQEEFHALAGFNNSNLDAGWKHQLSNEPGLMVSYDRHWRVWQASAFGLEADAIPDAGVTVGNVMTYAEAGGQLRIGRNLGVDYGIARVRPALSGTGWFDAKRMESPIGWYLFAGIQGRAVAHDIFLDGNDFQNSPSVKKNILVGDFSGGASVFYKDIAKLDFSFTERTKEFTTQKQMDHFGSASLSFRF